MRGATRGLPRRSPILVLLSPKHVTRCISAATTPDLIPQQRGRGGRSSPDFDRSFRRAFPCSSYGIATLTAGSLEFQDFIPGLG
uniref:Uncharacterized protein n=1 Tax=Salix viminalis TaxID=40686 RepID=A0A6N2KB73_SALVM